jgi:hypothetical protein
VLLAPAQCRLGGARGLEVSPRSLLQDQLVQCQIGHCFAQPAVLELKVLQPLHLLNLQPAVLLTRAVLRRSAGSRLPRPVPVRQERPPAAASQRSLQACDASSPLQSSSMPKTYLKSDHFNGGGSVRRFSDCHATVSFQSRCSQNNLGPVNHRLRSAVGFCLHATGQFSAHMIIPALYWRVPYDTVRASTSMVRRRLTTGRNLHFLADNASAQGISGVGALGFIGACVRPEALSLRAGAHAESIRCSRSVASGQRRSGRGRP